MSDSTASSDDLVTDQDRLLDQIVDEFTRQLRNGDCPSVTDFQQRHPQLKDQLSELLSSVEMIEQLKLSGAVTRGEAPIGSSFSPPETIGEYRIEEEIGRGGMGIVYRAVHRTLGRIVAIKVLPPDLATSPDRADRFRREAQAAAQLHHTNIVGVFGVGSNEALHYYVMDFVAGRGLDEIIGNTDNDPQEIARFGASLADALSYAHGQGILHRDLKPANFLLGDDGICRVTDFGLVKHAANELNLTKTGELIGTPQYLAPESLEGNYDASSEVYCLGLTLYEWLTRKPAFAKGTPAQVIRAITTVKPTPPRRVNSAIPVDLATVIEKAIVREPARRYPNAAAFRDDLLAFANGRAISARRATTVEHLRRWARGNPLSAALSAVSLLLLTLVAVVASAGYASTSDALQQLQLQTNRLHEQQQVTAQALQRAVDNERETATEFERAEANVAISMEALDEMFRQTMTRGATQLQAMEVEELEMDGFDELADLETSITAQDTQFLQKLLGFYQQFAARNADNAELANELARAFRRMGNIYQLVDDPASAVDAYRESLALYQWVSLTNPASAETILARIHASGELAAVLRDEDREAESTWLLREALGLIESQPDFEESDTWQQEHRRVLDEFPAGSRASTKN